MSVSKEKNLSSLYLELYRFEQNGEYERALKTCNKILHTSPKEASAFHCKVVCLIQVTKFDEALQNINKNPELSSNLYFEKAYCQYRLNLPEKALETIEKAPESDHQLVELKAQVLYRLEKYDESYSLYRDIIKNTSDDYDDERQANIAAVVSNLSNVTSIEPESPTYEILYNQAYKLIKAGKYVEAERKLKQCEKLCREYLEDDGCNDEEIEQELAIVKVQLAYCYQKQSRIKEAKGIYTSVLKQKSDDVGLTAVASNNTVVINKDQNVFDSKKRMKYATQELLNHKLNNYQRKTIDFNNCLLSYYINQLDQCRKLCDKLIEKWPDMVISASMIKVLLLAKNNAVQGALELLNELCKKMPEDKLYLQMMSVHLLLSQGNKKKACEVLHDLDDVTYRPGVVAALVSLYLALGDETGAAKVFEDTVSWYRKHQVNQGDLGNMWLKAAEFHMRLGHPVVAAESLEELLRNSSGDQRTIAKLIMAYIQFDKDKAKILSKKLPTTQEVTKDLNESEIETVTWIFGTKSQKNKMDSSPGTPLTELIVKKKNRKRKGKMPKSYNIEVLPDPERWLPKYERTGFRKKRDRRNKDIIKGSQGTSSAQADIYDFSKNAEQNIEDTMEPGDMKNVGNNSKMPQKKKKRKGNKW
ncbi:Signal recognition particle 72 [Carabus blaptoides fortunei]